MKNVLLLVSLLVASVAAVWLLTVVTADRLNWRPLEHRWPLLVGGGLAAWLLAIGGFVLITGASPASLFAGQG